MLFSATSVRSPLLLLLFATRCRVMLLLLCCGSGNAETERTKWGWDPHLCSFLGDVYVEETVWWEFLFSCAVSGTKKKKKTKTTHWRIFGARKRWEQTLLPPIKDGNGRKTHHVWQIPVTHHNNKLVGIRVHVTPKRGLTEQLGCHHVSHRDDPFQLTSLEQWMHSLLC